MIASLSSGGEKWWDDHRNDPIDKEFFCLCFAQLATTYIVTLNVDQIQVFLDLFRADLWINRHFREACQWLVRNKNRMPAYADFVQWRQNVSTLSED